MTAARVVISTTRLSGIPFCTTFGDSIKGALFVPGVEEAVFDAALGVREEGFFIGEIAFSDDLPGDFPSNRRDFAAVLPTRDAGALLPVLDDDVATALEREICLLTVSLLCLSINGDLAVVKAFAEFSRGLIAPPEVGGAVLGLDDVEPVVDCFDVVTDVLVVVPADVDLGFDVTLDVVDVFAVVNGDDLTSNVVVLAVVVFVLAGLAAATLFIVDFFSVDVVAVLSFDEEATVVLLVVLDFVVATRGEMLVFIVVAVVVVVAVLLDDVVVLMPATLPTLELAVTLVEPSVSCLGRAATDFFAMADCAGDDVVVTREVIVPIALEGDVGVIFVAVFVVDVAVTFVVDVVFVGRFVAVVVAFALTVLATAAFTIVSSSAVPVICSFDSSVFATSSGDAAFAVSRGLVSSGDAAFAVSRGLVSSSLLVGISSDAICCFSHTSRICATAISISFCSVSAAVIKVQADDTSV